MTPQDVRTARLALGLSQPQFAAVLGYGSASRISALEGGRENPGPAVTRLIRAYLDGYRPHDWPLPRVEISPQTV